jgi:hypothetical protein
MDDPGGSCERPDEILLGVEPEGLASPTGRRRACAGPIL